MSQNLDSYLKAIEQANKLNRSSEKAAELMIGAYRGSKGAGSTQPGSGGSYPLGRQSQGNWGMGQSSAAPGFCGPGPGAQVPVGTPVAGPCPPEFLCDCDLIGTTTFEDTADANVPIPSGGQFQVTITDFDAVALQPVAIWFTAFEAAADPDSQIANPVVELPCNIVDVRIGQSGQLRVNGLRRALNSAAFAATREPVCVDWAPFRSQNGQELFITFQNPVNAVANGIHVVLVLWCNVLQ